MKKDNTPIDTLTICSTINSKDQENGLTKWYITACTNPNNITVMPEMYASKLYEKYLMRKLIVQSQKIMMSAKQNNPDVYDILSNSHSIIGDLISVRPTLEVDIEKVDLLDKEILCHAIGNRGLAHAWGVGKTEKEA